MYYPVYERRVYQKRLAASSICWFIVLAVLTLLACFAPPLFTGARPWWETTGIFGSIGMFILGIFLFPWRTND